MTTDRPPFNMSAPNYDMTTAWNDSYMPPQLEQEYQLDSAMYGGIEADGSSYTRRQPTSSRAPGAGVAPFDSSFAQNIPAFTFTIPPQQAQTQMQGMSNGINYLAPHSPGQRSNHFSSPGPLFSSPSPSPSDLSGTSNMPGFAQYPQQVAGMRSGPPSAIDPSGAFNNQSGDSLYGADTMGYDAGYQHGQLQINTAPGLSRSPFFSTGFGSSPHTFTTSFKRLREDDNSGLEGEADAEPDDGPNMAEAAKPKPLGACSRCKGLKVKCEFKTDPDTCKRCLNGGHECIIPGRKKRRPPPKREHLLTKIREQADQIAQLMSQLEEATKKAQAQQFQPVDASSPSARSDSFSVVSSRITSPEVEQEVQGGVYKNDAEVLDWIAKARASFEAFGGYISMGGPSATREMLADDDFEGAESQEHGETEEYEFVFDNEGDEPAGDGDDAASASTSRRVKQGSATPDMKRLATIPTMAAPFGLMAQMSLDNRPVRRMRSKSDMGDEQEEVEGIAGDDYFRPSTIEKPLVSENHQPPHILRNGLVSPAEVEQLFKIYYDHMNLSVSLLDPVLYTAQKTYWRSPFLFTVICGIASRFYNDRPELYQQAMRYAQLAAGTALIGGQKSVEVVQAYILLALYPVPARKWEDDRSWIYLGVAIRIAMDLNLHRPNTAKPLNEQHAREMLNRTRVWLNCFNLDRSTGSQYGKPSIIRNTDYTANRCEQWWNSSPYNMKGFDIHLAAYNADLTVLASFRAEIHSDPSNPTGFNKNLDIAELASKYDDKLASLWETWIARVKEHDDPNDAQATFRTGLLRLAYSYARMSVLSFGFQYAFGKASVGQDIVLLERCLRAATDVLHAVLDDIGRPSQRIFLRHGPEAQSVFTTFASAFLIKLLHPRYDTYIGRQKRVEIRILVQRIVDLLGSPEIAIDDRHGPKLYARFLQSLLSSPAASIDRPFDKRQRVKAKSESPMVPKLELREIQTVLTKSMSQPPSARPSVEPEVPPSSETAYAQGLSAEPALMHSGDTNMNGYMIQPLPFEELLQSMQSVTDASSWGDYGAMPGFAWMGQNNVDVSMAYVGAMQT